MNTILQQRIEEAAQKCATTIDGKTMSSFAYLAAKQMANFILDNQWISVEEALPEEDIPNCFVAYKAMDVVLYSTGFYEKYYKVWYVDGVGYNAEVTHYMPIPSLEGGEE